MSGWDIGRSCLYDKNLVFAEFFLLFLFFVLLFAKPHSTVWYSKVFVEEILVKKEKVLDSKVYVAFVTYKSYDYI